MAQRIGGSCATFAVAHTRLAVQERSRRESAERALEALREMAAPIGHAIRDGVEIAIPARELVPGDVIVLRAGDRVPADARIALAVNLAIDGAALTGASAAVEKTSSRLDAAVLALGDRRNMAYAGTLVTRGRGQAVVVATGMGAEFGQIFAARAGVILADAH